ncbi:MULTISPECIES: type 1 glutamine amidotransferase [Rhizobium]|uniref:GMP synthase n=1 Tax=Rhizobium tropici TaxID=398 RepID=A0A329YEP0_RHITR|nr:MULTISPECIES: type 1 glutamine amidotransferase [Rhizobium]MBB3287266.1 GMP synthase (glutamine-hydrolyzing) [Rhizobium sp. BK252]MBB3402006.1 GMP synthase (glutamine-hydrolyzing) [Rhizobium sp. BK289]MBB3414583.1 GMP synthase (glutamine-hydrolyzing) [Rhizobium sp. BK284]MBB3482472.1 GMP synthase (glutamine-hydrolyzing) [Rhizobium sp. BK347]MDK4721321.1 type 1 glutamine amidotransferase [Rhizobium sp. CNPSo 3968]
MRVAIIENMKNTPLGALGIALEEAGADVEWFRPWSGEALPGETASHDALVVLGGEQSARDDDTHPYLPELARLMRRFEGEDKAVLGICLGSQILARAYEAENLLGTAHEFGWKTIGLTDEGRKDPLLANVGDEFTIFEWHSDTFTLPDGATRLAANGVTRNQAFRIGRATYGTQFHFEANAAVVERWRGEFRETIERKEPGWLESYPELVAKYAAAAETAGLAIARAWVRTIRVQAELPQAAEA